MRARGGFEHGAAQRHIGHAHATSPSSQSSGCTRERENSVTANTRPRAHERPAIGHVAGYVPANDAGSEETCAINGIITRSVHSDWDATVRKGTHASISREQKKWEQGRIFVAK